MFYTSDSLYMSEYDFYLRFYLRVQYIRILWNWKMKGYGNYRAEVRETY